MELKDKLANFYKEESSVNPIMCAGRMKKVHSDIRGPIFQEANRMSAAGIPILKLNTGNPATFGFKMPDSVRNALVENADKAVAYCDLKGMPAAREAIWAYEQSKGITSFTPDDIYIGNGVSELAPMCLTALLNPGDEILIPSPSYSLWTNAAYLAEATPVFYRCHQENNWQPDPEEIKSLITERTRAILIINPNNPTGVIYGPELLKELVEVARENKLLIFSDEIYDRLLLGDAVHVSTASLCPDLPVITFNGLSKSHVVCGFRCGWMCVSGPDELTKDYKAALTALAAMRLCGNALTQLVIPAALEDSAYTKQMMSPGGRLYEQSKAACDALEKIPGLTFVRNQAAFYVFPKLDIEQFGITDDRKFALDLLHEKHILLVAGSGFDWPEPDHFRLVLLPEAHELKKAVEDIGDFLSTYHQ